MDNNLCGNSWNDSMVYITLFQATSQDISVLKPAEQKLVEWETQPGFYTSLSKIISSKDVEISVRWLATVYLKNGADKYWRYNAPNGISAHEKSIIRSELLKCFDEPTDVIAPQLAVLIAKISRMDWPRDWPDLVGILINNVKNNDSEMLRYRSLLILSHVVKTLSAKRLSGDKKLFYELSVNIYPIMFEFWNYTVGNFLSADPHHRKTLKYKCELDMSLLTAKILSKLTIYGSNKPHLCVEAMNFMSVIFERTKILLQFRLTLDDVSEQCKELIEKHAITLIKVLFSMLEMHPLSYIDFIEMTLQHSFYYCFTEEGSKLIFEPILLRWLNLMKMMLICREYNADRSSSAVTDDDPVANVRKVKNSFFSPEVIHQIFYRLVNDYLILSEGDLTLWDADPEAYAAEQIGEGWKYDLKPCIESLFAAFLNDYRIREILIPIIVNVIDNNHASPDPNNMNAILKKDAVYNVFGLSVFFFFNDEIDYDKWFTQILLPELQVKNANYRILRRRIAWLIGKWTGVKLSAELYPLMCAEIINLLEPSEDIAVRLAAANTIKHIVDDFEFRGEVFLVHIPRCFQFLYLLLEQSAECETKMQVLMLLSFIIERVGWGIAPFFESLVSYLPRLWHHSIGHNMLRCAIVTTLTQIVKGLGDQCVTLDKFVMLVIEYSLDTHEEGHVYLLEDGLHLLMAYIENVTKNDNVLSVCHYLPPLIDRTTEHLTTILNIESAMVLLSPDKFLQMHGVNIIQSLMDLLPDINFEGATLIFGFFETCIKIRPHLSIELLSVFLQETILHTDHNKDVRPTVVTLRLSIISRIILFSIESFARIIENTSNERNIDRDTIFANYMDYWLHVMNIVWYPERRKLCGLALARLLTAGSNIVLDRFSSIFSTVVEVLNDILVSEEDGTYTDMYNTTEDGGNVSSEAEEQELKNGHEMRVSEMTYNDPVHKVDFPSYFQNELEQLRQQVGDTNFQQLMNTITTESLTQLQIYIKPT